jgi:hypothetical protein
LLVALDHSGSWFFRNEEVQQYVPPHEQVCSFAAGDPISSSSPISDDENAKKGNLLWQKDTVVIPATQAVEAGPNQARP